MYFKKGDIVQHARTKRQYLIIAVAFNSIKEVNEYVYRPLFPSDYETYTIEVTEMSKEIKDMYGQFVPQYTFLRHLFIKTPFESVREFMKVMNMNIAQKPSLEKNLPLHKANIKEEFKELLEAIEEKDMAHICKEAADLIYVVIGLFYGIGIDGEQIFAHVHHSNMSKINPLTGKVEKASNGKVKKGNNYSPPDIKKLLKESYQWTE